MKYWAYVNNEILGPFDKEKLLELPAFSPSLLVCPQTPVGEKTEDWKEASAYPELSAPAAAPAPVVNPAPAASPAPDTAAPDAQPAPGPKNTDLPPDQPASSFAPLTSASLEPVPPAEHADGGPAITINRLHKANEAAAPAPDARPQQAASSFDPLSLSQISRRSETLSAQNTPAGEPAGGTEREPEKPLQKEENAGQAPAPAAAIEPPKQAAAEPETFNRMASEVPSTGLMLDSLAQKLDALGKTSATRGELSETADVLKAKLDQLTGLVSEAKDPKFQKEIAEKLASLENAVADLKAGMITLQQAAAAAQQASPPPVPKAESVSDTVFGVQPPPRIDKPWTDQVAPSAGTIDSAGKKFNIGAGLAKILKPIAALALLAALLLGSVIGLKVFGVFDATKFIPFPLPFIGEQPLEQQPEAAQAAEQPEQAAQQPAPEPPQAAREPELAPEIIYFTRGYKTGTGAVSLEDKISEHSAKAGGEYARVSWKVKETGAGQYEIAATVPSKAGDLAYTYSVDYSKKSLLPADDNGKAAFDALVKESAPKAKGKSPRPKRRQAPKAQPKKAAVTPPPAAADDEYEYVYEDEDGTEVPAGADGTEE